MSVLLRGVAFLAATVVLAADAANHPKRPPWEKPPVEVGRYLFLENCSICHETEKPKSLKMGPSLNRFKSIPDARLKPNRDYVMLKVKAGGLVMPAFGDYLSDDQIRKIADYIFRR